MSEKFKKQARRDRKSEIYIKSVDASKKLAIRIVFIWRKRTTYQVYLICNKRDNIDRY